MFLVARVLEARRSGLSETDAIPEGLARTAGLITSAAAIMIVVFAAFTFGNFLVVKMIGFTLAVAVLIDATLVRIVIGPALLRTAGDWNWWPRGLATSRTAPMRRPTPRLTGTRFFVSSESTFREAGFTAKWIGTGSDRRAETITCISEGGDDLNAQYVEKLNRLTAESSRKREP
jgi:hypothetical protein